MDRDNGGEMIELEKIIELYMYKSPKTVKKLAKDIKSYIIEIVGEEKEDLVGKDYNILFNRGHNQLRTTILKRLEGEL